MQSHFYLITTEINREMGGERAERVKQPHPPSHIQHPVGLRSNKLCTQLCLGQPQSFNFAAVSELHNKDDNQIPLCTFFMIVENKK
jgi:hypothetical protein